MFYGHYLRFASLSLSLYFYEYNYYMQNLFIFFFFHYEHFHTLLHKNSLKQNIKRKTKHDYIVVVVVSLIKLTLMDFSVRPRRYRVWRKICLGGFNKNTLEKKNCSGSLGTSPFGDVSSAGELIQTPTQGVVLPADMVPWGLSLVLFWNYPSFRWGINAKFKFKYTWFFL